MSLVHFIYSITPSYPVPKSFTQNLKLVLWQNVSICQLQNLNNYGPIFVIARPFLYTQIPIMLLQWDNQTITARQSCRYWCCGHWKGRSSSEGEERGTDTLLISSTTLRASPETYRTALWYLPRHCCRVFRLFTYIYVWYEVFGNIVHVYNNLTM